MPERVAGFWIMAHSDSMPVAGVRALYGWGIEEPAALLRVSEREAAALRLRGYDMRPARVGYYGDEERGIWLHVDGTLTEGHPVALAGRFG